MVLKWCQDMLVGIGFYVVLLVMQCYIGLVGSKLFFYNLFKKNNYCLFWFIFKMLQFINRDLWYSCYFVYLVGVYDLCYMIEYYRI